MAGAMLFILSGARLGGAPRSLDTMESIILGAIAGGVFLFCVLVYFRPDKSRLTG